MHGSKDYANSNLDRGARKNIVGVFLAKQVFDVTDLLSKEIELSSQALDVGSGAAVHVKIEFTAEAILRILAILTHHDDGRLNCGQ